ncbi:MAG: manganese-dependent inorganic pyrophosphatase [Desulfurivibrionaceae bacterium]
MSINVVGHSSPDTDSVTAAIAYAHLLKAQGEDAIPCMQTSADNLSPETTAVLERFGLSMPAEINDAAGKTMALVDFSDVGQAPDNIKEAEIVAIVDHHKLGDITTSSPLYMNVQPVGCTCTILNEMYKMSGVEIPKDVAGGMLSAILSDTVNFKSPTCTDKDKEAVDELKKIAGVSDTEELFMSMLKAKSSVEGEPMDKLLFRDYKDFDMNGKKVGVGQLELATLDQVADIRDDLYKEMEKVKADGRHSVLLMLTDVVKEGTDLLVVSDDPSMIEKAFDSKLNGKSMWLEGMMSRKKQTVPNLQKAFGA